MMRDSTTGHALKMYEFNHSLTERIKAMRKLQGITSPHKYGYDKPSDPRDAVDFSKLKVLLPHDSNRGCVYIGDAGTFKEGRYVDIQLRKRVGEYTYILSGTFRVQDLLETLKDLSK